MKKRLIAALLACTMAGGVLAGCGSGNSENGDETSKAEAQENQPVDEEGNPSPYGKYEEPVTVEIVQSVDPTEIFPEGDSPTDNYYTRYVKENMNIDVKVKWQSSPSDFSQKFNLAIASNDLPDIMVVGASDFRKLLKSDLIEDLTPYYEEYASDLVKEDIEKTDGKAIENASVDGKMYALPSVQAEVDGYNMMWIRQDWLDELNLEAPTTVEELETVAKAFVDNNMGGENTIGILGPSIGGRLYNDFTAPTNNTCNLDGIFQAYKSWPGFWIEGEDGKAVYGSTTQETKEALGKLQEMYAEGILDQELGVRKDADEAWKSGKAGIVFYQWWLGYSVTDCLANDPDAEWKAYAAPLAEDGKWYAKLGGVGDYYCVVRKGYEHPESAILLNNFLRRDEGKMTQETSLGIGYYPGRLILGDIGDGAYSVRQLQNKLRGEEVEEYDSATHKLLDTDLASLDSCLKDFNDLSIQNWNTEDTNFGRIYSLLMGAADQVRAEDEGQLVRTYSLTYSQTETMEKKWANLKKKEDETFLKIIIGEADLDTFDTFVEEWYAEGGEEITAEVQEAINK